MSIFDRFRNQKKADFSNVGGGASSTAQEVRPTPQAQPAPQATSPMGASSTAQSMRTYVVKKGDSLSKIAREIYGDFNRWRAIFDANKDTIGNNPDLIHPGQVLRIPS